MMANVTFQPVFIGANPGFVLADGDRTVARVSVWDAHWSINGPGRVGIATVGDATTVVSREPALAHWLVNDLTSYFPEFEGIDLSRADFEDGDVEIATLTATELRASFGGFDVTIGGSQTIRPVTVEHWEMGGRVMRLTNLLSPSATATLARDGNRVDGEPSVAFVATSERWDIVT